MRHSSHRAITLSAREGTISDTRAYTRCLLQGFSGDHCAHVAVQVVRVVHGPVVEVPRSRRHRLDVGREVDSACACVRVWEVACVSDSAFDLRGLRML